MGSGETLITLSAGQLALREIPTVVPQKATGVSNQGSGVKAEDLVLLDLF